MRVTREEMLLHGMKWKEATKKPKVVKSKIGYFYVVNYTKPNFDFSAWNWRGWRPTRTGAAKRALHLYNKWERNRLKSEKGPIEYDPNTLLFEPSGREVRKAVRKLEETAKSLQH